MDKWIFVYDDGRTPAIHSAEVEADTMADAVAASGLRGVERNARCSTARTPYEHGRPTNRD